MAGHLVLPFYGYLAIVWVVLGGKFFLTNAFHIPTVVKSGNINQNAVNVMHNRSIEITFTYRFGGMSVQKPKKVKKPSTMMI